MKATKAMATKQDAALQEKQEQIALLNEKIESERRMAKFHARCAKESRAEVRLLEPMLKSLEESVAPLELAS